MASMPLMTESGQLELPPGWQSDTVEGGVDLRVVSSGRKYIVAAAGISGVLAGLRAIAHWNSAPPTFWLVVTAILAAFALWCALADDPQPRRLGQRVPSHRLGGG